jgi:hypothetical protein
MGKPRYYFCRTGQGQGEPVAELPPGFTISESVNGVVSLVKDRPWDYPCPGYGELSFRFLTDPHIAASQIWEYFDLSSSTML